MMEYYAVIKDNEKRLYVKNGHPSKDIDLKKGQRREVEYTLLFVKIGDVCIKMLIVTKSVDKIQGIPGPSCAR